MELQKKSKRVLAALLRIGWSVKRQGGTSHKVLQWEGSRKIYEHNN